MKAEVKGPMVSGSDTSTGPSPSCGEEKEAPTCGEDIETPIIASCD